MKEANQLKFRLLAHINFDVRALAGTGLGAYFLRFFTRIGDSKVIEDSNKIARKAEQKDKENMVTAARTVYHQIRQSGTSALDQRGISQSQVRDEDWVTCATFVCIYFLIVRT